MPFKFEKQSIPEVIVVIPKIFEDNRGQFFESYKYSDFKNNGIAEKFVQDNISQSKKGVLRGIHFQVAPYSQGKLIRCASGKILDVAIDLRKSSNTFKKFVMVELSSKNNNMLYVPPGFGHGFLTLSENAEISYKLTSEYNPVAERGIIWNDLDININWPIENPLLSAKDEILTSIKNAELFE